MMHYIPKKETTSLVREINMPCKGKIKSRKKKK